MSKLKVGVMGAGRGISMMKLLSNYPDAELAAICDNYEPNLANAKKVLEENGMNCAVYNNFDDFIASDIDAVVLANYAHQHAPFAIRALNAGKHVISEVVPCATIAEGIELIEAVEKSGLVYAFAENYCYMLHTFEMWHRIKNGEIGDIMYAEGAYVHDTTVVRPQLTYGDPNHWRNNSHPNFYCTHSLGPMLMTIGKRPVSVNGYELPNFGRGGKLPYNSGAGGIEMVTLENGCVCRSFHGLMRREDELNHTYLYYGDFGTMESSRFKDVPLMNVYKEGSSFCSGTWEKYDPVPRFEIPNNDAAAGHGYADYFAMHFFIQKILGREIGIEWSIDVYQAVEMGICGILAHRSALNGGITLDVPNFRNKAERDAYRDDRETTFTDVENGQLVPRTKFSYEDHEPDEKYYETLRYLYENNRNLRHYPL